MRTGITDPVYDRLRTTGRVALGFTLLGAFSLGFRMLGTPDLIQLVLPRLNILQCVSYAIIVAFAVYLAIFEAILRPLKHKQRKKQNSIRSQNAAFLPVPSAPDTPPRGDDISFTVDNLPPHSRVLHWCNTLSGGTWRDASVSCSHNSRLVTADASGTAVIRQTQPEEFTNELGDKQSPRVSYRVEVEPGVWSPVRSYVLPE